MSAVIRRRAKTPSRGLGGDSRWEAANSLIERGYTSVPNFVDTNVLNYAEDRDAKGKHAIARDLILGLWEDRDGVVSIQVLQEFYVNVTRKLKKPISNIKALKIVNEYLTWTVMENTGSLLISALRLQTKAQLSFWDSMVVQAAIEAGCTSLYSEDLNDGQEFGALKIVNPFN